MTQTSEHSFKTTTTRKTDQTNRLGPLELMIIARTGGKSMTFMMDREANIQL